MQWLLIVSIIIAIAIYAITVYAIVILYKLNKFAQHNIEQQTEFCKSHSKQFLTFAIISVILLTSIVLSWILLVAQYDTDQIPVALLYFILCSLMGSWLSIITFFIGFFVPKWRARHKKKNNTIKTVEYEVIKEEYEIVRDRVSEQPVYSKRYQDQSNLSPIQKVDNMTGSQFEIYMEQYFKRKGYQTLRTPASGDWGIDLIILTKTERIGIQLKRYSKKVSLQAVQEVLGGFEYYKLTKGMVITNNYFQQSAITLAKKSSKPIVLWNRDMLIKKLGE